MTYPEMNGKIVKFMRMNDSSMEHYAAERIEELERVLRDVKAYLELNNGEKRIIYKPVCDVLKLS